ncbi:hypothetical protein HX870_11485 [Pseudomonas gingeri]|uniref:DUF6680 family protein n=1 Tax=Pseudomonas gingeri TaxID=117681 RepID=UPI0015A1F739|nr:DUF6680 family protein [Pseudomonas gingeri]NWD68216.1 hypothetical protein [Pseudomonas gingeri]
MESLSVTNCLIILATLLSPLIAVQVTRRLDERNEIRGRKLSIFKTLMATRSYVSSWIHVEALNRIDLEFTKDRKKEKDVVEAWKAYHDHLHSLAASDAASQEQWGAKRVDVMVDMLHKMAVVLNYDFDKTHIKNSSYAPRIHSDTEAQQLKIRNGIIEVLAGDRAVPMSLTNLPPAPPPPERINE